MEPIQVQGAPSIYQCFEGVLDHLPKKIVDQKFQHALIIHGEKSWEVAQKHLTPLPIPTTHIRYNGECTYSEVERMNNVIKKEKIDVIIGVGGGKIIDLAKACGHFTNKQVIVIPTLASNCAAWTPLSVFYDQEGNFIEYKVFPRSTFMVLIEPKIIIDSPEDYLRAGIGDTIAKWYEADVITRNLPSKSIPLEISLHAARICRDVLIEEGKLAITALKQGILSPSFIRVIESIVIAGGMVGGYGDKYGRIAGAHSIHNGLTTVVETHNYLHGDKVAYGTLVQLSLEKRFDEITNLLPFYKSLKLPISLADLGIREQVEEAIKKIAIGATKPNESIHIMNVSSPVQVKESILSLEEFIAEKDDRL